MAKQQKMDGKERTERLLNAGAKLAAKHGAVNVTRRMVATAAKTSEPLVSHYLGTGDEAQKKYRARLKKLGLTEPSKEKIEEIGIKLRKVHGVRKAAPARKRKPQEVKAIRRKAAAKPKPKAPPAKRKAVKDLSKTGVKVAVAAGLIAKPKPSRKPKAPPVTAPSSETVQ